MPDAYEFAKPGFKYSLQTLLQELIAAGLIDKDTIFDQLYNLFNKQPVIPKIIWIGGRNELMKFIDLLFELGKVKDDKIYTRKKWVIGDKCFYMEKIKASNLSDYRRRFTLPKEKEAVLKKIVKQIIAPRRQIDK